jgi:uncharacterized protein YjbI with pentapeptide repeats
VEQQEKADFLEEFYYYWLQGVDSWNQWRSENITVRLGFENFELHNAELSGMDLRNIDFQNADLVGANLSGAKLDDANLNNANLSGSDLSGATLYRAYLMDTNLNGANLSETDFEGANLCNANLSGANLTNANLTESILVGVNFRCANLQSANLCYARAFNAILNDANLSNAALIKTDLRGTSLIRANLTEADLSASNLSESDLSEANLRKANLSYNGIVGNITNITGVNLSNADLSGANLSSADLSDTNLSNADLTGSMMYAVRALRTNFSSAILTGACLQNWNINSETKLDNIVCTFFYLKAEPSSADNEHYRDYPPSSDSYYYRERRPSSDSYFAHGEAVNLIQSVLETVDLVFANGIDWKAFLMSFQELRNQYGTNDISIQAIEKKSGGVFVIRLEIPLKSDKAEVESQIKELYEHKLQLLEAQYRTDIQIKDREIESYKRESTNMMEIVKLLASKPINVEAKAVAESQSNQDTFNTDLRGANVANFANKIQDNARQQANQNICATPEKQSLAESAAEIQKLLKILEQTNPNATEAEQKAFVSAAVSKTNQQRAVNAFKSGGKTAISEFLDNSLFNIAVAIIEGWNDDGNLKKD